MRRKFLLLLLATPILLFAQSNADFEAVEESVFNAEDAGELRALLSDDDSITGRFRTALIHYRLGNLLTNRDQTKEAISELEELNEETDNVYVISYLGIAYASEAGQRGMLGAIGSGNRALDTLNEAVEKYPSHYLPRFTRGMLLLFMPGILGGDEEQGLEDMEFVISALPALDRDDSYKAFAYFIYGIYWGKKAEDYEQAVYYIETAIPLIDPDDGDFIEKANEILEEFRAEL